MLNVDQFIFGVAAFLFAQLSYGFLFLRDWQGISHRWPLSAVLLVYLLGVLWMLLPELGGFMLPVLAYILAIGFMGFAAIQSNHSLHWSVLEALILILSDSLIAFDKFLQPIPNVSYGVMVTYYLAQWMLIEGFTKPRVNKQSKE
ncbi:lysoplasmalogenase [Paraglaciecola aquimarina]|uniref:Lysoplasmalogenase n=1 Tax=Paraglaciecola algarum TaxID=3050085 RepID=A0ABS9D786_9ALTE|nr:lysoplasmalogenase [Paraglaciecola sp. G1-23]